MDYARYIAIALYFGFLLFVGRYSYNKNANMGEYLLDNRRLGPVVTALSAGASDMSGWMLLGVPGALYATGLSTMWMVLGLVIGAYCNYLFLAKRLRVYTEVASDSITIPDFLQNRFKDETKILRIVSGLLILIFFTLYVSSGIIAGGKSFESFFGLDFKFGAIFTLAIVVFYTFFGGFRAVCITDAFQGMLMFLVLVAVPVVAFCNLNLPDGAAFWSEVAKYGKNHLNVFYDQTFLSILGLMAWGLGYFGQPHIIVRFMAIRSSKELAQARRIGIGWMAIGLAGAMMSGLIGFVYYSELNLPLADPEKVFLQLGETLFHPFFVGIIISAVLSAIMSTISSQLLVSASSVTQDFVFAVVAVALVATALAFSFNESVLNVVGYAWAGFGASFGPVLLFSLYWRRMSALAALLGMITGGATVIAWIAFGLNSYVYEILPGFAVSCVVIYLTSLYGDAIDKMSNEPNSATVQDEFEKMKTRL